MVPQPRPDRLPLRAVLSVEPPATLFGLAATLLELPKAMSSSYSKTMELTAKSLGITPPETDTPVRVAAKFVNGPGDNSAGAATSTAAPEPSLALLLLAALGGALVRASPRSR